MNCSNGLNKHVTSDSTIDVGLDNRKPWIQAGTLRPELDHNTGRHFDTPLRLVTSRPSFRQTRHLASHNISTIVHGTSKFRYTWRESWCNCARNALHADRGRVISLPRTFWSQNLTVDLGHIYLIPGIWQHDRNNIVTTNAQNNYILFEFFPSITKESWTDMHTESTKAPTCWQQAGETRLAA